MDSGCKDPLNLGTEEVVAIDELVGIVCEVAGKASGKFTTLAGPRECGGAIATTAC